MAIINLDKAGSAPEVKITVGYNQPATYKTWLKKPGGVKESLGNDNEINLASHGVTSASNMKGTRFIWDVRAINITGAENEKYHVSVSFIQDGIPVGENIVSSGKFNGNTAVWCYDSVIFDI